MTEKEKESDLPKEKLLDPDTTERSKRTPADSDDDDESTFHPTVQHPYVPAKVRIPDRRPTSKTTSFPTHIPQFSGSKGEDISTWIDDITCLGQVHGWDESTTILAMRLNLTGLAKRWYVRHEFGVSDGIDIITTSQDPIGR